MNRPINHLGALALVAALLPAAAQAVIKVNDDVNFKVGLLLQAQADWQEVANATNTASGGYQQNMFLRRARISPSSPIGPRAPSSP